MLSYYIVEQNWFGLALATDWRSDTLVFCRKPIFISRHGLKLPNTYPISLNCSPIPNLKTRLTYSQSKYTAKVNTVFLYCWASPNFNKIPSCSQSWYIVQVYPVLLHCKEAPDFVTLLRYVLAYHFAEVFQILKLCWRIPCPMTFLSYSQS